MKPQKVAEINRRLSLYENKIGEGIKNNKIRDSFKCWSIKTIETLSEGEANEIKPGFEKALLQINEIINKEPALILFVSKSEILTCLSLISKKIGQIDSAIEFSKVALDMNNLINAFISVEADWDFLGFTFEDLDKALKIKGIATGETVVERIYKNLLKKQKL